MLERLQAQLRETLTGLDRILDGTRDAQRDLTAEERTQLDELYTRAQGLQADIQRVESAEALRTAAARPAHEPTRPEVRDGQRESRVQLLERNALTEQRERQFRFGALLIDVVNRTVPGAPHTERVRELRAATGMGELVPSDGGFLVGTDMSNELLMLAHDASQLVGRCRQIPISAASNALEINAIAETSRATGSRWGGVQAYWASEAGTVTATKPKLRRVRLQLEKLFGLYYATDELLQDAAALGALAEQAFREEFGWIFDNSIINGSGMAVPTGILNSGALISVSAETGQAATTIVAENVIKMWARMWSRSRANAVWLINQDIEPQLYTMALNVGTGGVPVYMPANGLAGQPFGTMFGRPVLPIEQCATLGTVGDIILADLSQYLWIEKGGLQQASSTHVQFLADETVYRFTQRANGEPWWNSALNPANGSNTQSPFVALATRS